MTTLLSKSTVFFLFLIIFIVSCSKEDLKDIVKPIPPVDTTGKNPTPVEKGALRFTTTTDLTGHPYHNSNLHAVVTIINNKDQEVVKDSMLTLNLNGMVTTSSMQLPLGEYKLTRFRLVYGGVNTHFAAPIANSAKASLVQKPLSIDFKVERDASKDVTVEVVRVQEGERPPVFGYPVGSFDNNQEENSPFLKVKIKAIMQIGDVLYDSIPASLTLTTWNNKGEMTTTYGSLAAGVNELQVLKTGVKFEFRISKWGTNDAVTLKKEEIDDKTVYVLGGNKAPKKLKSEITFKQVNGSYLAETKTSYTYDAAGNLLRIEYYKRKADNTPFLAMTDRFNYTGNKVQKISRVDEETNSPISTISFTYDHQGKVIAMNEKTVNGETNGRVQYHYYERPEISINYQYPGKTDEMDYSMVFRNGNKVEDAATTTNHSNELGTYSYDFNINPYRHMNWPNLFLSNSSKNNLTFQNKTYSGNYPAAEPYSLTYTYDADGYPTEVIKNFKTYPGGQYGFSTKTVFNY